MLFSFIDIYLIIISFGGGHLTREPEDGIIYLTKSVLAPISAQKLFSIHLPYPDRSYLVLEPEGRGRAVDLKFDKQGKYKIHTAA